MDAKYVKMIEDLVAELLDRYMPHLQASKDEYEYCAIVTAAVVFKELAITEFKKGILRDTDEDPQDICLTMENKAKEIAEVIRSRCLYTQQSLN